MDPCIVFGCAFSLASVLPSLGAIKTYDLLFCPRAVLISGMQLARVLRSRAKVIQKMEIGCPAKGHARRTERCKVQSKENMKTS